MKLKQWLYGAAALAMLAACSDKDIAPDSGGGEPAETSNGYIGIRIQLPTVPSTRAGSNNDQFEDGVSDEYKLAKATLILFRCDVADVTTNGEYDASKDLATNAKCIGAYDLTKSKQIADKDEADQITTEVIRFANVTGMEKSANCKLYALVFANGDDYGLNTQYVKTNFVKKNKTIQDFQETASDKLLYAQSTPGSGYASNIFMSNSPLSVYRGGKYNPNQDGKPDYDAENSSSLSTIPVLPVLVEINKEVYDTEEKAIANPAGIIHIERAVGKVTCSNFTTETDVVVNVDNKNYKLLVESIKWDLGQDMQDTYLVRNTNRKPVDTTLGTDNMWLWNYKTDITSTGIFSGDDGLYRMLGHTQIVSQDVDKNPVIYYRPYFCQVPGYGVAKSGDVDKIYENKTFRGIMVEDEDGKITPSNYSEKTQSYYLDPSHAVDWNAKSAFYPHENTFPVDYMKYANTTRIGFWVTFSFAELDVNGAVVKENNKIKTLDMSGKDFYTRGYDRSVIYRNNPLIDFAYENMSQDPAIKTAVTNAMDQDEKGQYDSLDLRDLITITDGVDDDGQSIITEIKFKEVTQFPENIQGLFSNKPEYTFDLNKYNDLEKVYTYKGGKVFYEVRIKHFGDDLTPWILKDHTQASDINSSYGAEATRNKNYLGRYGIVRNNWYDLNVENITRLGPPVDPAKWEDAWPGKPDDNKDEYIAVILRVLSWAKRTQSVTL